MSATARRIGAAYLRKVGIELQPGDLGSDLEGDFAQAAQQAGLPHPQRELQLVPGRKWTCDFVWPAEKVVVEVEGGTRHGKGRHSRGKGFDEDCRKCFQLNMAGYLVIRVTGTHIQSGEAVDWVRAALALRSAP